MDKRDTRMERLRIMKLTLNMIIDETELPKSIDLKKATKSEVGEALSQLFFDRYVNWELGDKEWGERCNLVEDERDIGRED